MLTERKNKIIDMNKERARFICQTWQKDRQGQNSEEDKTLY